MHPDTYGPTAWTYVSEIFPLNCRGTANGLCAATNCTISDGQCPVAFNFALVFFIPLAFRNIQWKNVYRNSEILKDAYGTSLWSFLYHHVYLSIFPVP